MEMIYTVEADNRTTTQYILHHWRYPKIYYRIMILINCVQIITPYSNKISVSYV